MFLEIPIKLESYVTEIKRQTKYIQNTNKITLLQMGSTKIEDKTKYLILLYNPFPVSIKINCDFFTKESRVCKMYPGEFILHPDSAYALVVYVSGDQKVGIDENKFVANLKNNISKRISRLNNNVEEVGFEPHNIYKIQANDFELEKTVNLDTYLKNTDNDKFEKYKKDYSAYVSVLLSKVDVQDRVVKIGVKFSNSLSTSNLELDGYRLKLFDSKKIIHVEVKQKIRLKSQSSKIAYIQLNRIEFDQVDQKNMQFKIVII
ncbi:MAG: hypothetical protein ACRC5R_06390 [Mycoplasmatales bacterium]